MDQEVSKTLGELELKLQQLERELTSIGRRDSVPVTETVRGPIEPTPDPAGPMPGAAEPAAAEEPSFKLVDEAVEAKAPGSAEERAYEETISDSDKFGSPAVFGGEEVPTQPRVIPERDWAASRETAYGEIPTAPEDPSAMPPPASQRTVEVADLLRFRDKLMQTIDELVAEYDRLLSLHDGPGSGSGS